MTQSNGELAIRLSHGIGQRLTKQDCKFPSLQAVPLRAITDAYRLAVFIVTKHTNTTLYHSTGALGQKVLCVYKNQQKEKSGIQFHSIYKKQSPYC